MLLQPVVLPSGECTNTHGANLGYGGCPYCDPYGRVAAAEEAVERAEDAEREANQRGKGLKDQLSITENSLTEARRVVAQLQNEIDELRARPPQQRMEH